MLNLLSSFVSRFKLSVCAFFKGSFIEQALSTSITSAKDLKILNLFESLLADLLDVKRKRSSTAENGNAVWITDSVHGLVGINKFSNFASASL